MEEELQKKLLSELDQLLDDIRASSLYHDFKKVQAQLKKDTEVMLLIQNIKQWQRQIVLTEHGYQKQDVISLEGNITEALTTLEQIPLYTEYVRLQQELDDLIQEITNRINSFFPN